MKKNQRVKKFNTMLILMLLLLFAVGSRTEAKAVPKINCKKVTLIQGKKKKLKVSGVSSKKVKWTSKNNSIATVSRKGIVRAKKKGNTVIIAKVGKKKFRCRVTVKGKVSVKKKKKEQHKKTIFDVAEDKANAVIRELFKGHPEKYSEVERAYKIADWICTHTSYSKKGYNVIYKGSDYFLGPADWETALIKGTVMCSGYSSLYRHMGEKVNLTFKSCVSWKENHAMSIVRIDGKYYWTDLSARAGTTKLKGRVFRSKYMRDWNYLKSFSNIELCTSRRFDDFHYKVEKKYYKVLENSNGTSQEIEVSKKEFEEVWNKETPEHKTLSSTEYGETRVVYPEDSGGRYFYYEDFVGTDMYERGDYMNY